MPVLHLIADDLTGALDTAAQFVGCIGAIPVCWLGGLEPVASLAMDSGTREASAERAQAVAGDLAPLLSPRPGLIAFKKLDSLLRGHPGVELAACLRRLQPRHCIVAPAFPFQGRVTRGGRQFARSDGDWRAVGEDLRATLADHGVPVVLARAGDALPEGVSLWDAESDADLTTIAAAGRGREVLWCGSSGLAGALAGEQRRWRQALPRPLLGLFGSDHPVTAGQLAAVGGHAMRLAGGAAGAGRLSARLGEHEVAMAAFELPAGMSRADAARRIACEMAELTDRIAAPGTLAVAGGETLRALCDRLGAASLEVRGQVMPGIPVSVMRGGRWDGVTVVSKSGAFGEVDLLARIIALGAAQDGETGA